MERPGTRPNRASHRVSSRETQSSLPCAPRVDESRLSTIEPRSDGPSHPERRTRVLLARVPLLEVARALVVAAAARTRVGDSLHVSTRRPEVPFFYRPAKSGTARRTASAFRRHDTRACDEDCSFSPTRASPIFTPPRKRHCSGGERLWDRSELVPGADAPSTLRGLGLRWLRARGT